MKTFKEVNVIEVSPAEIFCRIKEILKIRRVAHITGFSL